MNEKKSIWDILDSVLPSATSVYGKIREKETGVNPFKVQQQQAQTQVQQQDETSAPSVQVMPKRNNTIWFVLGGIAVGAGAYYLIKKYYKK